MIKWNWKQRIFRRIRNNEIYKIRKTHFYYRNIGFKKLFLYCNGILNLEEYMNIRFEGFKEEEIKEI